MKPINPPRPTPPTAAIPNYFLLNQLILNSVRAVLQAGTSDSCPQSPKAPACMQEPQPPSLPASQQRTGHVGMSCSQTASTSSLPLTQTLLSLRPQPGPCLNIHFWSGSNFCLSQSNNQNCFMQTVHLQGLRPLLQRSQYPTTSPGKYQTCKGAINNDTPPLVIFFGSQNTTDSIFTGSFSVSKISILKAISGILVGSFLRKRPKLPLQILYS